MKAQRTESLLTQSLEHLQKTGDVAATVRRCPEKTETMRPLLETAQQLQAHYAVAPPPPGGLSAGRARVLAFAAEQRALGRGVVTGRRDAPRRSLALFWKWAAFLTVLAFLMLPLRGPLASAASTTLPGNPLYILKLSAEDQLFASMNEADAKVVLAVSLANERVDEARALVAKQQEIPADVLFRADYMLRTALFSAAWAPEPLMPSMLGYIAHHTQQQAQQLETLKSTTVASNRTALEDLQTLLLKTQVIALAALEDPATFRAAYQAGTPEKMPLPSGGPLSGVLITAELREWMMTAPAPAVWPQATVPDR